MAKSRSRKYKSRAARRSAKIIKSYTRKDGKSIPAHCSVKDYTITFPTTLSATGKAIKPHCRYTPKKVRQASKSKRDTLNKVYKQARRMYSQNPDSFQMRIKSRKGSRKSRKGSRKSRSHKKSHGRKGSKKSHSRKSKKSYRKKRSHRKSH